MKRHHIKSFQSDQYKVADKRIKTLVADAWAMYVAPDLNMKFDYERL